jgi:hypothetical protein
MSLSLRSVDLLESHLDILGRVRDCETPMPTWVQRFCHSSYLQIGVRWYRKALTCSRAEFCRGALGGDSAWFFWRNLSVWRCG